MPGKENNTKCASCSLVSGMMIQSDFVRNLIPKSLGKWPEPFGERRKSSPMKPGRGAKPSELG
jgi:hypothetical protein